MSRTSGKMARDMAATKPGKYRIQWIDMLAACAVKRPFLVSTGSDDAADALGGGSRSPRVPAAHLLTSFEACGCLRRRAPGPKAFGLLVCSCRCPELVVTSESGRSWSTLGDVHNRSSGKVRPQAFRERTRHHGPPRSGSTFACQISLPGKSSLAGSHLSASPVLARLVLD